MYKFIQYMFNTENLTTIKMVSEKYVIWKKSQQILLTIVLDDSPQIQLQDLIQKLGQTTLPIDLYMSFDFYGFWRGGMPNEKLSFVWPSKETSFIHEFFVSDYNDLVELKDQFDTDLEHIYEQQIDSHLETRFCMNSDVRPDRIISASIVIGVEEMNAHLYKSPRKYKFV